MTAQLLCFSKGYYRMELACVSCSNAGIKCIRQEGCRDAPCLYSHILLSPWPCAFCLGGKSVPRA